MQDISLPIGKWYLQIIAYVFQYALIIVIIQAASHITNQSMFSGARSHLIMPNLLYTNTHNIPYNHLMILLILCSATAHTLMIFVEATMAVKI